MIVREAIEEDFTAITAIYNKVRRNSTAIYSDKPATVTRWWDSLLSGIFAPGPDIAIPSN